MTRDQIGQACALGTAIAWAMAVVLFKRAGDRVPPLLLNLFKNVVGVLLLAVTLVVMGEGWSSLDRFPRSDIYTLMISGVLGIAIADTIFFHALNRCGVGLISIVDCSYSPSVLLFSFLLLGETVTVYHGVGGLLVLIGVYAASGHAPPPGRTRGQIITGILLGVLAMAMMAYGIVLAKPVLDVGEFPLLWATMIRMLAGTSALALTLLNRKRLGECIEVFRPSRTWLTTIPAAVLGAYISMVLWVAGFKYTTAGVAAILNQTSVIFALLLATVVLHESLTRRKLVAISLALMGVVLIIFWGRSPTPPVPPLALGGGGG